MFVQYPISVEMLQKVRIGKVINQFIKNFGGFLESIKEYNEVKLEQLDLILEEAKKVI